MFAQKHPTIGERFATSAPWEVDSSSVNGLGLVAWDDLETNREARSSIPQVGVSGDRIQFLGNAITRKIKDSRVQKRDSYTIYLTALCKGASHRDS
jgi:hypothetical protein